MMKINIGFNRKVGEANFSSRGGSANLEIEVESGLVREPNALESKIAKTKRPVVDRLPVPNDPQRTARMKRIVEHVRRAIEASHFFPTPSPIACGSCPYRQACRAWPE